MGELIRRGMITSTRIVYEEILARQRELLRWLDGWPKIFPEPKLDMLNLVVDINTRFPFLVGKDRGKLGAAPHVIARAMTLLEGGLSGRSPVVVMEGAGSPDRDTSISHAVQECRLSCISLVDMLDRERVGR